MGEIAEWMINNMVDRHLRGPDLFNYEYMGDWSSPYKEHICASMEGVMPEGYSIDIDKKKCVTPVCRGSYVNILEPRPLPQSEKLAWGLQCLFPKSDPVVEEWVKALNPLYGKVLVDKFGQGKAQEVAKQISILRSFPLRDGDKPEDTAKISDPSVLEGHYFMNTNNQFRQPYVIGPMGKPVDPAQLTQDDVYSGAWYRVMLEFWFYDKAGNKGISTSVAAIMKVKDDTNLGSGTSTTEAASAFEGFKEEAASVFSGDDTATEGSTPAATPDPAEDFNFM
ncbi:MAG: DUF2815 family protein [Gammaproteobacteria bacterium]|nr:DUF2815 family protein [Gammaproteobacteria bacterium]